MREIPTPAHGGQIARIARTYGVDARKLLDFSVNVNPLGTPAAVQQVLRDPRMSGMLHEYPDVDGTVLKDAIAHRYNVPRDCIVVGNGSAALLDAALRSRDACLCAVPVPAFSEYRRAACAAGHAWQAIALDVAAGVDANAQRVVECVRNMRPGVLIVNTPHNPSGQVWSSRTVLAMAASAAANGTRVIVDEAFIDYVPQESVMHHAVKSDNLIVLRSVTKFYAMPALRVGYAVASPDVARRLSSLLPSWPVSTIALYAAAAALGDAVFDAQSIAANDRARADVAGALARLGARVTPSAANFLLVDLPAEWGTRTHICEELVRRHGIVVRNCRDYEGLEETGHVRVAVKDERSNERLVEALRAFSLKAALV